MPDLRQQGPRFSPVLHPRDVVNNSNEENGSIPQENCLSFQKYCAHLCQDKACGSMNRDLADRAALRQEAAMKNSSIRRHDLQPRADELSLAEWQRNFRHGSGKPSVNVPIIAANTVAFRKTRSRSSPITSSNRCSTAWRKGRQRKPRSHLLPLQMHTRVRT